MDRIRLQIAVTLDEPARSKAIRLNALARQTLPSDFVIDGIEFFPHITLYPPEFPSKNISAIIQKLEQLAANTRKFSLEFSQLVCADGYLMLLCREHQAINLVHRNIVTELNPLREGILREKYSSLEYMSALPQKQQDLIKQYGYQYVFEYYHPHLTLAMYQDDQQAQTVYPVLSRDIENTKFLDMQVANITVFEAGENAKCNKIIAQFALL